MPLVSTAWRRIPPLGIVLDNFSPDLSTGADRRVADWAAANNVELAYVPTSASWLNRIGAQFPGAALLHLDGTDHTSHHEQASMIRRYIAWRNQNAPKSATMRNRRQAKVA
jgi:hypothetical protein